MQYYRVKSKVSNRIKNIVRIEDREELLDTLQISVVKKIKAEAAERARRYNKAIALDNLKIEEWRNGERDRLKLTTIGTDFLRLSKDKRFIETSQRVFIEVEEATRLAKLIDSKNIIGSKINDEFIVTAFNGVLKAGCHNIPIDEINSIRAELQI